MYEIYMYACSQTCFTHLLICISLCYPSHSNYSPEEFCDKMCSFEDKKLCKWD